MNVDISEVGCRSCGKKRLIIDVNRSKIKLRACSLDCLPYPHRMGSLACKLDKHGNYKTSIEAILTKDDEEYPF